MVLSTKVFKRIEEIPAEDWNRIFPKVLDGYSYFKALDESCLEQFSFYYVLVYDGPTLVGAAPCFIMQYSLDTTLQGPLKSISTAIQKKFPRLFNLKALMCGQPLGQGRIGIVGDRPAVISAIVARMEQIAKNEKAAILVFKEFDACYADALACLEKDGFHKFESIPNTEQEIPYKDFDDYLKSLSYATRYDLKRKFKKAASQAKIELEITHDLKDLWDEAHALYMQMVLKHEMSLEVLPKTFFRQLAKNMPEETIFFLWRIEGKLVAFAIGLASEDLFIDFYIGLDYTVAHKYHLYFVRFRDMMTWCLEHKIKTYEMGSTNYEPKKRLGFKFVPMFIYVKLRHRWLNPLMGVVCKFLEPSRHDPALRKMKKK